MSNAVNTFEELGLPIPTHWESQLALDVPPPSVHMNYPWNSPIDGPAGHTADGGGLQKHSVGGHYPYIVAARGDIWGVLLHNDWAPFVGNIKYSNMVAAELAQWARDGALKEDVMGGYATVPFWSKQ